MQWPWAVSPRMRNRLSRWLDSGQSGTEKILNAVVQRFPFCRHHRKNIAIPDLLKISCLLQLGNASAHSAGAGLLLDSWIEHALTTLSRQTWSVPFWEWTFSKIVKENASYTVIPTTSPLTGKWSCITEYADHCAEVHDDEHALL